MIRTPMRTTRCWETWGFDAAREVEDRAGRRVQRIERGAYAGTVGRGAGMAAHKAGQNVHRRHARSGRALSSHRGEIDLWEIDQPGPGRTGVRTWAGKAQNLWGESEADPSTVLEDRGGRTRVGDSAGGRGLGRLGGFEHAA